MAKTCRTCEFRDFYCDEPAGALIHIRRLGADGGDCPFWSRCETPLLVDELGDALAIVWKRRYTDGDEAGVTPGYTTRLTPDECDVVRAALARYQQEVGDGEDV